MLLKPIFRDKVGMDRNNQFQSREYEVNNSWQWHARPVGYLASYLINELDDGCLEKIKIESKGKKFFYDIERPPDTSELLFNIHPPIVIRFSIKGKNEETEERVLNTIEKILNADYKKRASVSEIKKYISNPHLLGKK